MSSCAPTACSSTTRVPISSTVSWPTWLTTARPTSWRRGADILWTGSSPSRKKKAWSAARCSTTATWCGRRGSSYWRTATMTTTFTIPYWSWWPSVKKKVALGKIFLAQLVDCVLIQSTYLSKKSAWIYTFRPFWYWVEYIVQIPVLYAKLLLIAINIRRTRSIYSCSFYFLNSWIMTFFSLSIGGIMLLLINLLYIIPAAFSVELLFHRSLPNGPKSSRISYTLWVWAWCLATDVSGFTESGANPILPFQLLVLVLFFFVFYFWYCFWPN